MKLQEFQSLFDHDYEALVLEHKQNQGTLLESVFRVGSTAFFEFVNAARKLHKENKIQVTDIEQELLESDLGRYAEFEGQQVPLDCPFLNEAEYQGEEVELNSPKRGGSKKFYVYVKDPKTDNVKKVEFGASDGGQNLAVDFTDKEARDSFAARHNCDQKKDKTTAGYWSCNLPKYADDLGLKGGGQFYW